MCIVQVICMFMCICVLYYPRFSCFKISIIILNALDRKVLDKFQKKTLLEQNWIMKGRKTKKTYYNEWKSWISFEFGSVDIIFIWIFQSKDNDFKNFMFVFSVICNPNY